MNHLKSPDERITSAIESLTTNDPYRFAADVRSIILESTDPSSLLDTLDPDTIFDYLSDKDLLKSHVHDYIYDNESSILELICSDPSDPDRVLPYYHETAVAQYLAERYDATDAHIEFFERLSKENYRKVFRELNESDLETIISFATTILKERTDNE